MSTVPLTTGNIHLLRAQLSTPSTDSTDEPVQPAIRLKEAQGVVYATLKALRGLGKAGGEALRGQEIFIQGSRICCRKTTNPKPDLKDPGYWEQKRQELDKIYWPLIEETRAPEPDGSPQIEEDRNPECLSNENMRKEEVLAWVQTSGRAALTERPVSPCTGPDTPTLSRSKRKRALDEEETSEDGYLPSKRLRDHRTDCLGAEHELVVSSEGATRKARDCAIVSGKQRTNVRKQMTQCSARRQPVRRSKRLKAMAMKKNGT